MTDFKTRMTNINQRPWLSFAAIIINVILFLASLVVNRGVNNWMLSPSGETLSKMGGFSVYKVVKDHQIWRIFTSIWLHAGFVHLGVNMLGVYFLGALKLEQEFGRIRLAIIYVLTGIFGSIFVGMTTGPRHAYDVTIGASGALFGLEGAIISEIITNWEHYLDKRMVLRFYGHDGPEMGRKGILLFYIGSVLISFIAVAFIPHVSVAGHFGGLFWGLLLGFVLLAKGDTETILPVTEVKKGGGYSKRQRMGCLVALGILVLSFVVGLVVMFERKFYY